MADAKLVGLTLGEIDANNIHKKAWNASLDIGES
jgi:hypothetical protein